MNLSHHVVVQPTACSSQPRGCTMMRGASWHTPPRAAKCRSRWGMTLLRRAAKQQHLVQFANHHSSYSQLATRNSPAADRPQGYAPATERVGALALVHCALGTAEAVKAPASGRLPKNRRGQNPRPPYTPVPTDHIVVVDSLETLARATAALSQPGSGEWPAKSIQAVGVDCEWKPFQRGGVETPVALLQVVTRTDAFLIDMLHWARPLGAQRAARAAGGDHNEDDEGPLTAEEVAIDNFLTFLFSAKHLMRVGFKFGYDAHRLQTSYPQLPVFQPGGALQFGRASPVVEIHHMAQRMMKNGLSVNGRLSLKILVQRVISRPVDKGEQVSDWSQRPLTARQMRYAADDGYVLVAMFDALVARAGRQADPSKFLTQYATHLYRDRAAMAAAANQGRSSDPSLLRHVRMKGAEGTSCNTAVDLASLTTAALGRPLDAKGRHVRAAAAEAAGHLKTKLVLDRAGHIVWENAMMMFVTVGKDGVFEEGGSGWIEEGATVALRKEFLEKAEKQAAEAASSSPGEELAPKPLLLFCRRRGKPTVFCGRVAVVKVHNTPRISWTLLDHAALKESSAFQKLLV